MEKNRIVIIAGPTAVGKTEYTIELAKRFNGEIISCDSMQGYKMMDIGSAKPTPEEMSRVPHHLVDFLDPSKEFTVAEYYELAKEKAFDIARRGKLPFVAGGTGLYMNTFIYDMDFASPPPEDRVLRKKLYDEAEEFGREYVHNILKELDPEAASKIHPNNLQKTVRAVEIAKSGTEIKDFSKDPEPNSLFDPLLICFDRDREELYDRINRRTDKLFEIGLVDEVRGLMEAGLDIDDISMKGIGYKEVIMYLEGQLTLEESIDLVKRNSRHYAKRQLTWFRRYDNMKWFTITDYCSNEEFLGDVTQWLKKEL